MNQSVNKESPFSTASAEKALWYIRENAAFESHAVCNRRGRTVPLDVSRSLSFDTPYIITQAVERK